MLLQLGLSGCATKRTAGWEQTSSGSNLSATEEKSLMDQAEKSWKLRHQKEDLQKAIDAFEKIVAANPENYKALTRLCRGYYLMADGHTDAKEEKRRLWEIGTSWGEKAMATNADFRNKVKAEDGAVEKALDKLTKNEIEAIYWTAVNLGKWGSLSGIATVLKYKARVKEMINRVGQLDNAFFHGAYFRYWGAFYAIAPGFAGGDMDKSRESYEQAFKVAPYYLGTYVLMAENYAPKKKDTKLFEEKLQFVLKAKTDSEMDVMPENIMEQRKAKKLLERKNELF
jgi:tetratricopeptide (TPR) repeat protein